MTHRYRRRLPSCGRRARRKRGHGEGGAAGVATRSVGWCSLHRLPDAAGCIEGPQSPQSPTPPQSHPRMHTQGQPARSWPPSCGRLRALPPRQPPAGQPGHVAQHAEPRCPPRPAAPPRGGAPQCRGSDCRGRGGMGVGGCGWVGARRAGEEQTVPGRGKGQAAGSMLEGAICNSRPRQRAVVDCRAQPHPPPPPPPAPNG
jgi:hypothetical protein